MSGLLRVGDKVRFASAACARTLDAMGYDCKDVLTVRSVGDFKLNDGAPSQYVEVTGGQLIFGYWLEKAAPGTDADFDPAVAQALRLVASSGSLTNLILESVQRRLSAIEAAIGAKS